MVDLREKVQQRLEVLQTSLLQITAQRGVLKEIETATQQQINLLQTLLTPEEEK